MDKFKWVKINTGNKLWHAITCDQKTSVIAVIESNNDTSSVSGKIINWHRPISYQSVKKAKAFMNPFLNSMLDYGSNSNEKIKYVYNAKGGTGKSNCVARATAIATNIDYDKILNALQKEIEKRHPNKNKNAEDGIAFYIIANFYEKKLGLVGIQFTGRGIRIDKLPKDRVIIVGYSEGHTSVILNGEINDTGEFHLTRKNNIRHINHCWVFPEKLNETQLKNIWKIKIDKYN